MLKERGKPVLLFRRSKVIREIQEIRSPEKLKQLACEEHSNVGAVLINKVKRSPLPSPGLQDDLVNYDNYETANPKIDERRREISLLNAIAAKGSFQTDSDINQLSIVTLAHKLESGLDTSLDNKGRLKHQRYKAKKVESSCDFGFGVSR